jgi:hypothetical protein
MNSWRTAECLAQLGYEVVVLTRPEKAKGIGARVALLGSDRAPKVVSVTDHIAASVSNGQVGVYTRYAPWQNRALKEARRRGLHSLFEQHRLIGIMTALPARCDQIYRHFAPEGGVW